VILKTLDFVGTAILGVEKVSVDKCLEKLKLCKHEPICWNCFVRFGMDLGMKSGLILIDLHKNIYIVIKGNWT
jgi:hypothetical protein